MLLHLLHLLPMIYFTGFSAVVISVTKINGFMIISYDKRQRVALACQLTTCGLLWLCCSVCLSASLDLFQHGAVLAHWPTLPFLVSPHEFVLLFIQQVPVLAVRNDQPSVPSLKLFYEIF